MLRQDEAVAPPRPGIHRQPCRRAVSWSRQCDPARCLRYCPTSPQGSPALLLAPTASPPLRTPGQHVNNVPVPALAHVPATSSSRSLIINFPPALQRGAHRLPPPSSKHRRHPLRVYDVFHCHQHGVLSYKLASHASTHLAGTTCVRLGAPTPPRHPPSTQRVASSSAQHTVLHSLACFQKHLHTRRETATHPRPPCHASPYPSPLRDRSWTTTC